MIEVEGYKMFRGKMLITPIGGFMDPFEEYGDWLYKPEYECWYCNGSSYPARICSVQSDEI